MPGLELLIEHYQQKRSSGELPCRLEKPCAGGHPPPPLSLSVGYTNIFHQAISAGFYDTNSDMGMTVFLQTISQD